MGLEVSRKDLAEYGYSLPAAVERALGTGIGEEALIKADLSTGEGGIGLRRPESTADMVFCGARVAARPPVVDGLADLAQAELLGGGTRLRNLTRKQSYRWRGLRHGWKGGGMVW